MPKKLRGAALKKKRAADKRGGAKKSSKPGWLKKKIRRG